VETLSKPGAESFNGRFSEVLAGRLRSIGRRRTASEPVALAEPPAESKMSCLAIGASTGGLHAVTALLRALPARIGVPILITQHLPTVFVPFFARQLEAASGRIVTVAEPGRALAAEEIILAPGDAHLGLERQGESVLIRLDRNPAPAGCLPSVDVMLESVARIYGGGAIGVMLSGMGRDGLAGSRLVVESGGTMLAQDRASAAVWGMPRVVAEAGLASAVLPPAEIAACIAGRMEAASCRCATRRAESSPACSRPEPASS
jgi:two-component system chemotaxis response regulator CheB